MKYLVEALAEIKEIERKTGWFGWFEVYFSVSLDSSYSKFLKREHLRLEAAVKRGTEGLKAINNKQREHLRLEAAVERTEGLKAINNKQPPTA